MSATRSCSLSLRHAAAIVVLCALAYRLDATETTLKVRYRSAQTIYLDAGSAGGLVIGDRLEVVRGSESVGQIEVVFVAEHSASCTIVEEQDFIVSGDLVRPSASSLPVPGESSPVPVEIAQAESPPQTGDQATPSEPDDRASSNTEDSEDLAAIKQVIAAQSAELALAPSAVIPGRWQPPRSVRQRTTQVSGTVVLEFENFTDESEAQKLDFQRLGARVSLRILDIGGHPYTLRVRARTQQNRRSLVGSANVPIAERRDRFYELSLVYDPPQGRFAYRVGRMSASPFVGIGYIDGFLGQMALTSSVEVGGFVGASGDIDNFGFDTGRQKYGVFTRFTSSRTDSGLPWEVIMAGVREQGVTDISREYVTLQSRFSGRGRFSFFQRAEVDVNRGWRKELTGKSAQVSNLSLVGTAQLSRFSRLSVSYDRFEPYRTEESRPLPEEIFNAFLRQGWRASLYFGKPRGINFSLNAGFRDQEGEAESTISYGLGVRYVDVASVGLSLGANFLGFANPFNEGYVATLRASQPLPGGHLIDLTLGNRISSNLLFEDADRKSYWARAGAWIQLPKHLFATTEYELGRGDDLQGQRLSLGLGYRF
jgi:hypothetical protein